MVRWTSLIKWSEVVRFNCLIYHLWEIDLTHHNPYCNTQWRMQNAQFTLHTAHCTPHTGSLLCKLHITLHTEYYKLHTLHCTIHTAHCTSHNTHCTLYIAQPMDAGPSISQYWIHQGCCDRGDNSLGPHSGESLSSFLKLCWTPEHFLHFLVLLEQPKLHQFC